MPPSPNRLSPGLPLYAGGSNGNLYRFIVAESSAWEDLANPTAAGIVGLEMQSGTLYGMSASACDRNLNPTMAIGIVAATWDTMDAGYPTGVASFTVGAGSNVLYAANSTTTLWAYHDLFATARPVLTSPANGASIPVDPVTGLAILPITLAWQSVGTGVGAGNRVDIWIKEKASGWSPPPTFNNVAVSVTSPQFILTADWCAAANLTMTAGTEYEWRVRFDRAVSGEIARTPWSDPYTIIVQELPPEVDIEHFTIERMFINFDKRPKLDEIIANASFALPADATYDLTVDDVSVDIDGINITIPAGSFKQIGKPALQRYVYKSPPGIKPRISMSLDFKKGEWRLTANDIDASIVDNSDGVTVKFTIGSMLGIDDIQMWVGRLSYIARQ